MDNIPHAITIHNHVLMHSGLSAHQLRLYAFMLYQQGNKPMVVPGIVKSIESFLTPPFTDLYTEKIWCIVDSRYVKRRLLELVSKGIVSVVPDGKGTQFVALTSEQIATRLQQCGTLTGKAQ